MPVVTRFAPSPNGALHLGHAYSAVIAAYEARSRGGEFLLRIEDIDGPRSRPEFADEFRHDLEWLGLEWREVPAQSTRLATYRAAAEKLGSNILVAQGESRQSHRTLIRLRFASIWTGRLPGVASLFGKTFLPA